MRSLFVLEFSDLETARILGAEVCLALRNVLTVKSVEFEPNNPIRLRAFGKSEGSSSPLTLSPSYKKTRLRSPSPDSQVEDASVLFIEDTRPTIIDHIEIPAYDKKFNVLDTPKNEEKDKPKSTNFSVACFNCDGNHTLRECKQPRNFARIEEKRKELNKAKFSRYHVEDQDEGDKFIPGVISRDLRKALGLERNQLPLHIYRMRIYGYPPGWLQHAKVSHSGLALFDSHGNAVKGSDEDSNDASTKDKFDIKNIINFPGFNVRPSSKIVDESKKLGYPPYSESNSKMSMIEQLAPRAAKAYKRKKLKRTKPENLKNEIQTSADMDIDSDENLEVNGNGYLDHFVPPLPPNSPPPLPPPIEIPPPPPLDLPPSPNDSKELVNDSADLLNVTDDIRKSPTLADLEAEKLMIMAALDEKNTENDDSLDKRLSNSELSSIDNDSLTQIDNNFSIIQSNSSITEKGSVCSSDFGTPVYSFTSFSKLPNADDFSKNICDIINFENLPDSTGKYEQMRGVIKKVREAIEKLHDKAED